MKNPALLMGMIMMIAFASCSPTDGTVNQSNSIIPGPTSDVELEDRNSEMEAIEPDEIQLEPTQTSPGENDVGPSEMAEMSAMTPGHLEVSNPDKLPQVSKAKEDLADYLNVSIDDIEIIMVELVTWPNSGMGCPHPEMAYKQVPVDGLLIRLKVDGVAYNYHSGGSRDPFLCQPSPAVKATPPGINIEDFITPPSGNIDE